MSPEPKVRSAGDFTGFEKQRLAKEQSNALKEREGEISVATAVAAEEEENGIFDPQSGERLNAPAVTQVAHEPEQFKDPEFAEEAVYTGKEAPEEIEILKTVTRPQAQAIFTPFVTIRVNQDIDEMTYGMTPSGYPNNFTFKEGPQYRVKRDIYEHLAARGLIHSVVS